MPTLREQVAQRMRADHLAKWKPNTKSWEEIDEGMREVWLLHADSALKVLYDERRYIVYHVGDLAADYSDGSTNYLSKE